MDGQHSRSRISKAARPALLWIVALVAALLFFPSSPAHGQEGDEPADQSRAVSAVGVSATNTDAFLSDGDSDGKADAGDTIRHTVVVQNGGPDPATGVTFNDTLDPNTSLVAGSVNRWPVATNDVYQGYGNTRLAVGDTVTGPHRSVSGDVMDNDVDLDNDTITVTAITNGATTAGGTVTMDADGTFTYTPPVDTTTTNDNDTFTYVITDGRGGSDTGTVTIQLHERIWYVDDNGSVTGDGRSHNPFNTFTAVNLSGPGGVGDVDAPNDYIFVHSGAYPTGLILEANQRLHGEPHGLTVNTHQLHPASNTRPVFGGTGIALASGNDVRELDITNAAATGISGSGITGSTIEDVTITGGSTTAAISLNNVQGTHSLTGMSIVNPTGTAFDLNGASGTTPSISYSGPITKNTSGRLVNINNLGTGGSATFNGSLSATNTGSTGIAITNSAGNTSFSDVDLGLAGTRLTSDALTFSGNTGGTHSFTTLDIFTNGGRGIVGLSGSGTININTSNAADVGNINTQARRAIDLSGIGLTATLNNVTVNNSAGAANGGGINLINSPGTKTISNLAVTIDGASANDAGTGVFLNNAGTFNVPAGTIAATDGTAFNAQGNTALNVSLTSVNASNATNGILLSNTTGSFAVNGSGSADCTNSGNCNGGTIQNTTGDAVRLNSATNVTLKNMNFSNVATTDGGACDNVLNTDCNAAIDMQTVTGVTLNNLNINGTGEGGINGHTVTNFSLADSLVTNTGNAEREHGVRFTQLLGTASITNSTISNSAERNMQVNNTSGNLTATISGSTFQNSGRFDDVFPGDGLQFFADGTNNTKLTLSDNDFINHDSRAADLYSQGASSHLRVTINNNTTFQENYQGLHLSASNNGLLTFLVQNVSLTNTSPGADIDGDFLPPSNKITVFTLGNATVHGRINATTINSTLGQGDAGVGIRVNNNESSDTRVQIDGNTISVPIGPAIDAQTRHANAPNDQIGRMDALITGNTASVTESTNAFHAIFVTASQLHTMCALITGNNGNAASGTQHGIRPQKGTNATFQLQGYSGDGTAATVATHLDNVNPATTDTIQALGAGYTGGTCNSPDLGPLSQAAPEPIGHSAAPEEASPASTSAEAIAADTRADEANRFGMGAAAPAEAATDEAASADTQSGDDERVTATTRNITGLNLGNIPAGGDVTVTFDVLVIGPIATNKNYLLNQGQVTSSAPTVNTQDPGNPGPNGETRTPTDTPPTVAVTLAAGVTDPTNDNPVNFTVTFAEPVTDFDDSTDVTVGGTSGADTAVITGSGDTYNVAVSGMDNDGTVTLGVNAGAAVDEVNNANLASPSSASTNYDGTAPTVTVNRAAGQDAATNSSAVNFIVVFSEAVTDFAEADVSLTGLTGTVLVTGGGTTYNIAITGLTGDGTITASVPADSARDAAGNGNTASTGDNDVTLDTTRPSVAVSEATGQDDPTSTSPVNFAVVFSEPVDDFTDSDVSLSGTANPDTVVVTGSGDTYNVEVSGMDADGTVVISIGENAAHDAAGNGNIASTGDSTVTYDASGPTVTIDEAVGQNDPTNASPINFAVVFSEPVADFDDSDVTVGGTAFLVPALETATVTGSGTTYNVQISGMDNDGTVTISIAEDAAHDEAGNGNAAPTGDNSVTYDTTRPTVSVERAAGQDGTTSASTINFEVEFNEPVLNFTESDVSLTAPAGAQVTLTESDPPLNGTLYNVAVSGMEASGSVVVAIPADVAQDAAGNTNTASTTVNGNDVDFELAVAYVATDSDCASNLPCFTTVQAAIDAVMNGGTVNVYGDTYDEAITLERGITVNLQELVAFEGSLAFDNGLLVLGSNNLILSTDFTWSGTPSATSMIVVNGTGQVSKLWPGTGSFVFPVGETTNGADYTPATINLTAGNFSPDASVRVGVTDAKHPNNPNTGTFLTRYWTVTADSDEITNYTYDVLFQYTADDVEGTVDDESKLVGSRWDGTDWQTLDPVNSATHHFTGSGLTSFSDFTAGDAPPLEVALAGFTASPSDSHVLLSWETISEGSNAGFNLYRSTDANTSGEQLNDALIASEAPDSSEGFSYDWIDNDVEVGVTYYYWLETVSTTGETQRHGPVSATVQVPTSVTLGSINAGAATPSLWMFAALGLTALAALTLVRRRA